MIVSSNKILKRNNLKILIVKTDSFKSLLNSKNSGKYFLYKMNNGLYGKLAIIRVFVESGWGYRGSYCLSLGEENIIEKCINLYGKENFIYEYN